MAKGIKKRNSVVNFMLSIELDLIAKDYVAFPATKVADKCNASIYFKFFLFTFVDTDVLGRFYKEKKIVNYGSGVFL